MSEPTSGEAPHPVAVVSILDAATLVVLYPDGTYFVGGREDRRCSEHGRGVECEHAQSPGSDVPVLHIEDVADKVAQSESVRAWVADQTSGEVETDG